MDNSEQLPLPQEMMLPTLRAVIDLGGEAEYADIDDLALDLAHISEDQRGILYDEDATASGPKILHRIAWARSMLKRIGALEGAGHGRWATTPEGQELGELGDAEAAAVIGKKLAQAYETVEPDSTQLEAFRANAATGSPTAMSVRDLIGLWGVSRRRAGVIERVVTGLGAHGLTTDPDFTVGGLDTIVSLVLQKDQTEAPEVSPTPQEEPSAESHIGGLVVGNIPSATGGVRSITPQDDLLTAQSEMQAHDYSQLAVMTGTRHLAGAISWESIAKALLLAQQVGLNDCIEPNPTVVRLTQPLLEAVPAISEAGYVFVRDAHNEVTGIITTADLTDQFADLTRPFLLVGEVERMLRQAVNRSFTIEVLYEFVDPDDDREVEGAQSLTLGEVQHLLEVPSNFELLGWQADRAVLGRQLDRVRAIRNEVMHFSPDPISPRDISLLRSFADWIRVLESTAPPQ